ncbi:DUF4329 domain-containing protein [Luteimonas suaedae]|uniref:DUF4329 domain-containing protein n=1 Tax=Luteimonas suaedae TaxID=2605430 RepID=UPI0011EBBC26|nr:DUF4329 domain-containing protein [Luteimonas suaedae]
MGIDIGGVVDRVVDAVQNALTPDRDNPRYQGVVDRLVSPDATQEQRDRAYDLVAQVEEDAQACYTDEALTDRAADAIAEDRTVPVNVGAVAPLVPPGTSLGPFASADEAAIAMMEYSNPLSIAANRENGGLVLEDADGNFYVTTPMPGTLDGFNPGNVPVPDGMEMIGAYHGHADYSRADGTRTDKANDEFNSDHFSEQDKRVAEAGYYGPVIYVSTPGGDFRKYDSATDQDTVIN